MRLKKSLLASLLIAGVIITQTGCSRTQEPVESDNYFLDTTCHISIYATDANGKLDEEAANDAMTAAWDLCRNLDKTLSKTVDTSDVSRINTAKGEWVKVSDDTLVLLEKAVSYAELSKGRFDPTIGRITDLWDYHSDDPVVPDDSEIQDALAHMDYRCIELDKAACSVRLTDPQAKLDLGGIAKGYIGDRMAAALREAGVTSAIVNLGGNIITIGSKPGDDPFVIGIEKPYSDRTEIVGSVEVTDATVVTSGVYERQFEKDGKIYHHILSTSTGYPVDTDIDAVTLVVDEGGDAEGAGDSVDGAGDFSDGAGDLAAVTGRSVDADALSTICLIMGYDEASKLIDSMDGIEAAFCFPDGTVKMTGGMEMNEE